MKKSLLLVAIAVFISGACIPPGQIKKHSAPGQIKKETGEHPGKGK